MRPNRSPFLINEVLFDKSFNQFQRVFLEVFWTQKMGWLLNLLFDQNLKLINHKLNGNFKSHIILEEIQKWLKKDL